MARFVSADASAEAPCSGRSVPMISVSPLGAAAAPVPAAELPLSLSSEPPQAARATAPRTSTSGAMVFFHPVFIQFPSSGGSTRPVPRHPPRPTHGSRTRIRESIAPIPTTQ